MEFVCADLFVGGKCSRKLFLHFHCADGRKLKGIGGVQLLDANGMPIETVTLNEDPSAGTPLGPGLHCALRAVIPNEGSGKFGGWECLTK